MGRGRERGARDIDLHRERGSGGGREARTIWKKLSSKRTFKKRHLTMDAGPPKSTPDPCFRNNALENQVRG